jgi:hypothetical protein
MPLIGINQPGWAPRGPTTFEKVIGGLDAASKILGLGLTGVQLYQKSQELGQQKDILGLKRQEGEVSEAEKLRPLTAEETTKGMAGAILPNAAVYKGVPVTAREKANPFAELLGSLKVQEAQKNLAKPSLTPGQEMVDKEFGKDYAETLAQGGSSIIDKNLRGLKKTLENLPSLTGWDRATGVLPKGLMDVVNPEAADIQDVVHDVVTKNLRATLGSQFTDREGARILSLSYNPRLPVEINQRRLTALFHQISDAARVKKDAMDYFQKTGSLAGYKGGLPSLDMDAIESIGKSPAQKHPADLAPASREEKIKRLREIGVGE